MSLYAATLLIKVILTNTEEKIFANNTYFKYFIKFVWQIFYEEITRTNIELRE